MKSCILLILCFCVIVLQSFVDSTAVVCLQSLKGRPYQFCSSCDVSGGYADCSHCSSSITYCQVSKGQCTCNAGYTYPPINARANNEAQKQDSIGTVVDSNIKKKDHDTVNSADTDDVKIQDKVHGTLL